MPTEGELQKLKIISYKDEKFSQKADDIEVLINPENYKHTHKIQYQTPKTTETAGKISKFVGLEPQNIDFELFFDATGAIPAARNKIKSVPDAIKQLKNVAYEYDGEIHSPKYLKLIWGELDFRCRLLSMNIEYTLFEPSGTPLRAKAQVSFQEFLSSEALSRLENKNSPDLSHIRTVKAGDNLPLMCFRIYGDSSHYLMVAEHNKLEHFRDLEPGSEIVFPPL